MANSTMLTSKGITCAVVRTAPHLQAHGFPSVAEVGQSPRTALVTAVAAGGACVAVVLENGSKP